MRRRGLTITICFLAVLALASIGFASWIITNPNTETVKPGEITVDDVTSQVFKIETSWDETSGGKINFGKPTDYEAKDSDWLTNDSETNEQLTTDLTLTFSVEAGVDLAASLNANPLQITFETYKNAVTPEPNHQHSYNEETGICSCGKLNDEKELALYSDLTLAKPLIKVKDASGNFTELTGSLDGSHLLDGNKIVIRIEFKWGTATGGINPYDYYNNIPFGTKEDESSDTIEVIAETYLTKLKEDFTGVSYKVVIDEAPGTDSGEGTE